MQIQRTHTKLESPPQIVDDNTATASWVVTVEDINEEAVFEITSIPNATVNENELYTGTTPALTGDYPAHRSIEYTLNVER